MLFRHDPALLDEFAQLSVATLHLDAVDALVVAPDAVRERLERARARLTDSPESTWPSVAAWRRAFSQLGLKPTQYRCASESLLRRLRSEGSLPAIHPLVDTCNALSAESGIPIAVFDLEHVVGDLTVRRAHGTESYQSFAGAVEHPEPGEVIFADDAENAHARRWSHRQSALSAIRPATRSVLVVIEAMHESGARDVQSVRAALIDLVGDACTVRSA